jgi:serpin B
MSSTRRWLAVLLAAAALAACGTDADQAALSEPVPSATDALEVVQAAVLERAEPQISDANDVGAVGVATRKFALDLYKRVAAEKKGNVLVGPYSAWLALTMTWAGAAGATADELAEALRFPLPEDRLLPAANALDRLLASRANDDKVTLNVANRLWGQKGVQFKPEFLDAMTKHFGAPLVAADFAGDPEGARKQINTWVAERTEGKIPELFPAGKIEPATVLALVNAVYLNAPWEFPFEPASTSDAAFTRRDGTKVTVPFMRYDEYLPTHVTADLAAVELPYAGSSLSMVAIMPRRDFAGYEKRFDDAELQRVLGKIKDGGIHLAMPKFTFSTHASLIPALKAMGVRSAFGPGADFSRMADIPLYIKEAEHEAFIDVDEEGTEAAAATGVAMVGSHGPTVDLNQPFLFVILDRTTNATLFVGRVTDPSAS